MIRNILRTSYTVQYCIRRGICEIVFLAERQRRSEIRDKKNGMDGARNGAMGDKMKHGVIGWETKEWDGLFQSSSR